MTTADIVRAAADAFIAENTVLTPTQRLLETAKRSLLFYQRNIYELRQIGGNDREMAAWIESRHRAADRVADLQSMASASF
jgi:hypothetical protein